MVMYNPSPENRKPFDASVILGILRVTKQTDVAKEYARLHRVVSKNFERDRALGYGWDPESFWTYIWGNTGWIILIRA
jgi:hypothetical protein